MKSMPQEVEVWCVIPAIRAEMSKQMLKLGISQSDIAHKLNVSRAAITQYIKNKRAHDIEFDDDIKKLIKISAKRIIEDNTDTMKEIQQICEKIKDDKKLCAIHKKYDNVECDCDVCFK